MTDPELLRRLWLALDDPESPVHFWTVDGGHLLADDLLDLLLETAPIERCIQRNHKKHFWVDASAPSNPWKFCPGDHHPDDDCPKTVLRSLIPGHADKVIHESAEQTAAPSPEPTGTPVQTDRPLSVPHYPGCPMSVPLTCTCSRFWHPMSDPAGAKRG